MNDPSPKRTGAWLFAGACLAWTLAGLIGLAGGPRALCALVALPGFPLAAVGCYKLAS